MYVQFLLDLADQLDEEGKFDQANMVADSFEEFLELLGAGKLTFNNQFSGGARDPRGPYGNPGRGPMPAFGVPGPQ